LDSRPVGVFDSGVGGLTVLREIISQVPNESLIYFGDTARFPYGTKNLEDVKKFVFKIVEFLCSKQVKLIVIACNTASAAALEDLRANFDIPVIGVIEPGARTAAGNTHCKRIGVIATEGTVRSRAYDSAIEKIDPDIRLFSSAAPLLVEYIEKGILKGDGLNRQILAYLEPIIKEDIDVLILGCTHFPLIEKQIAECCNAGFKIISSAIETAKDVKNTLDRLDMHSPVGLKPARTFYETGKDSKLHEFGKMFFGREIPEAVKVKLDL